MLQFISRLFGGSKSEKDVKQIQPVVAKINDLLFGMAFSLRRTILPQRAVLQPHSKMPRRSIQVWIFRLRLRTLPNLKKL